MIVFKKGDILNENTEVIVNPVNCVGVMGKGLALQFKKKYPDNYISYREAFDDGNILPGKVHLFKTNKKINPKYIINFPTKIHWKDKSEIIYIVAGLNDLVRVCREKKISSIAIPPLGCGLGGLNWERIRTRIVSVMECMSDMEIIIFEPI
jgi:O-acetyl-ADP-ribose deacetylase (regulator of RNase III)